MMKKIDNFVRSKTGQIGIGALLVLMIISVLYFGQDNMNGLTGTAGSADSAGLCPQTIGYWENNVNKVYIASRTRGVQETRESLDLAFSNIANNSPLFRSRIDLSNPIELDNPTPLTAEEADMILQRNSSSYSGDANSMLARALQQNLGAWLNMESGKIAPDAWVVLADIPGGTFEGALEDALLEAQNIILNGGDLERAKEIANLINNGYLGEDANDVNVDCSVEETIFPPDLQPSP